MSTLRASAKTEISRLYFFIVFFPDDAAHLHYKPHAHALPCHSPRAVTSYADLFFGLSRNLSLGRNDCVMSKRRSAPKPQQWTKTTGSKINKTKKCCLSAYKGSFNIYQVAWDDEEVLCSREACRKNLWGLDGLMVTEKGPKKLLIWCATVQRGWGRTPFVWVKLYQSNPPK